MKNNYLQEAIRIGDQLIHTAEHTPHGILWKTRGRDRNGKVVWRESEDIYTGVSGIVLFLLSLYKATRNANYLQASEKAMNWVEWYSKNNKTKNYAFYTGRMGVSFTYLKLFEESKNKSYITKALAIAKESLIFLEEPYVVNDLLNGISGTLLGLLHLHAATNDYSLLDYIQQYINKLLSNARFDKRGLYWDIDQFEIHPLCGFSHGSSGIGFVFLELGHYFQNPAYYYIGEQAFAYENQFFSKDINNWPHFRLHLYTSDECKKFEKLYKQEGIAPFLRYIDMNAWCHGAVGIGLSRLRAFELLKNNKYRKDIVHAYNKTKLTKRPSFTLCHGLGGNMELITERSLAFHNKRDINYVRHIANNALLQKKKMNMYVSGFIDNDSETREEYSLFNGASGIGYFFLRVSNPSEISSILMPKISSIFKKPSFETHTLTSIKRALLKNIFRRTIERAEQFAPKQIKQYFQEGEYSKQISEIASFIKFIIYLIPSLDKEQAEALRECFVLEMMKIQLTRKRVSNGLLYIKERINTKNAKKLLMLTDEELQKNILHLSSETRIVSVTNKQDTAFLFKLTATTVEESQINQFCSLVLKAFTKSISVKNVIITISEKYKTQSPEYTDDITERIMIQIKEAIRYGILLPES